MKSLGWFADDPGDQGNSGVETLQKKFYRYCQYMEISEVELSTFGPRGFEIKGSKRSV
jgi:hypothetical protein